MIEDNELYSIEWIDIENTEMDYENYLNDIENFFKEDFGETDKNEINNHMKQIELTLKEKLLIVEEDESIESLHLIAWNNQPLKNKIMSNAVEIFLKNKDILSELENERKKYNTFFEFNRRTGLGRAYKTASMKVKRAEKLILKTKQ